jgi:hypothetical protein
VGAGKKSAEHGKEIPEEFQLYDTFLFYTRRAMPGLQAA